MLSTRIRYSPTLTGAGVQRWAALGPNGPALGFLGQEGGEAQAQAAVQTGFEAGGKLTLPPWTMAVALAAGLGIGVFIGMGLRAT